MWATIPKARIVEENSLFMWYWPVMKMGNNLKATLKKLQKQEAGQVLTLFMEVPSRAL